MVTNYTKYQIIWHEFRNSWYRMKIPGIIWTFWIWKFRIFGENSGKLFTLYPTDRIAQPSTCYHVQASAGCSPLLTPLPLLFYPVPDRGTSKGRDRRALQQLALNVHVKHSDLTWPDLNPVPSSQLADDLATTPLRLIMPYTMYLNINCEWDVDPW